MEGDAKVAFLSLDCVDGGIGVKLNVQVPADLDQFRRDNSHGTFVGGKSFVQLCHHPTDGGGSFH